jgi:hypothetical protein
MTKNLDAMLMSNRKQDATATTTVESCIVCVDTIAGILTMIETETKNVKEEDFSKAIYKYRKYCSS